MGTLILCSHPLAALPYYVERAGLNVYSLEELSYYIENNLYLLEQDFMSGELCDWIGEELGMNAAADALRGIRNKDGGLSEFVLYILSQSGYCDRDKRKQIADALRGMEQKSEYERIKMRADRHMENGSYISAVYEYRKLLKQEEEKNPVLIGNVWHNLGTAYVRLFLFEEAGDCYKRAYEQNENPESMRECLYTCRCLHDEERFRQYAAEFGLDGESAYEIGRALTEASQSEAVRQGEAALRSLFTGERNEEIQKQVEEWKDTYRKNCRI